jgi:hypothetical protein
MPPQTAAAAAVPAAAGNASAAVTGVQAAVTRCSCPVNCGANNINSSSSSSNFRLPPQAVVTGLTDVSGLSGLSGQPGCASLSVLPITNASSTAAEADETASLQPSISVASNTSTVISSCFSAHAGSLKEKPSWHGA